MGETPTPGPAGRPPNPQPSWSGGLQRKGLRMVSRKAWLVVGAMSLACGAMGCPREAAAPEPWASAPVVVSSADAASLTLRIDDVLVVTGKTGTEVSSKGSWNKTLPAAIRAKLEGAGFKVAEAGAPADVVASIQA